MSHEFSSVADDFFVNMNLQTTLALPQGRETVLHFFEAVQKQFAEMTNFFQRDSGEFVLESDRDKGQYQWLELQSHRLTAGQFNPPDLADAYGLHEWLLERSVYYLGVSGLDVECLDVLFGFNLDYRGNRDAIVTEALVGGSALAALGADAAMNPIEFEPNLVLAMDEDCSRQARLLLETRSSTYQVRTGQYDDEPVSVYFTVRQYPRPGELIPLKETFAQLYELCEDLSRRTVIPNVIHPIATAIASAD